MGEVYRGLVVCQPLYCGWPGSLPARESARAGKPPVAPDAQFMSWQTASHVARLNDENQR